MSLVTTKMEREYEANFMRSLNRDLYFRLFMQFSSENLVKTIKRNGLDFPDALDRSPVQEAILNAKPEVLFHLKFDQAFIFEADGSMFSGSSAVIFNSQVLLKSTTE